MKILQVSPAYFPAISIGGPIFSMLSLAKLLSRHHALDTLSTQLGLSDCERKRVIFDVPCSSPGGGTILYKRYYGYPNFTFSPSTVSWLVRNLRSYDLAILHGVWNFPVIAAAQICHAQGVPYIVFPHGTLNPRAIELRASCQKHALLNLGVRKNLGHAARIAFSTHSEAERVAAYLRQPLTPFVLPNIVEASDFASLPERGSFRVRHGISESTQVIIHYGRVARVKGIEFVVRAVARLRGQKRDVVLVVVGGDEGGYRTHLENIASELGVRGSLIFTGLLDRQEGRKVLVDADVFVLASHSENFGIAVIEAMLCRIPVVVSDNVGLAEELVRGDVGVMVSVDADGVLLAKAIALLLDDKPRRQSLGKRGRQFAIDNYDVSAVQGRIEQLVAVSVKPPR